jgi:hypothetical protein
MSNSFASALATLAVLMSAGGASSQSLPDAFEKPPVELESWKAATSFIGPRASHAAIIAGNHIFVLGGYSMEPAYTLFDDVQVGSIGNDGLITSIGWQKTTSFKIARSGLAAVADGSFVYISGGYSQQGTLADTQHAPLNADGTLGPWQTSVHSMVVPRSNHRLELIRTGQGKKYLAAIAGVGEIGADTVHFDHMEVAELAIDGSVGEWKMCPFHLKGGRSAPATFVDGGRLYVLGGWGDLLLSDVFNDVQFAPLRPDGCADPWHTNATGLLMPLYGHTLALTNSGGNQVAVVLGGNSGNGNYASAVQASALSPAGGTARWFFSRAPVPSARWGHATVQYNDFVYVMGGAAHTPSSFLSDVQVSRFKSP